MTWLDALGWAGSALLVYSVMQTRVLRFRVLNLGACVVLTVFNALLGIWPMVAMNLALTAINLWHIRTMVSQRHDDTAFTVIEVGPQDDYLRHVLRLHEADILRFQPDLVWDGAQPDRSAYLVLRGDETVGLVLLRDAGDGTAQVELDWVTPRFRDFSPGEFVWRDNAGLREKGFRRVVTPPAMVAPYYEKLAGFRKDGPSYVMDLRG